MPVLIPVVFFVDRSQAAARASSPELLLLVPRMSPELQLALALSSLPGSEKSLVERRD